MLQVRCVRVRLHIVSHTQAIIGGGRPTVHCLGRRRMAALVRSFTKKQNTIDQQGQ